MNLSKEFEELSETLKQQRGEIQVQIHLANIEAKQEWQKAEKLWDKFVDALVEVSDENKEASAELIHATKATGDELKEAYQHFSERLEK